MSTSFDTRKQHVKFFLNFKIGINKKFLMNIIFFSKRNKVLSWNLVHVLSHLKTELR